MRSERLSFLVQFDTGVIACMFVCTCVCVLVRARESKDVTVYTSQERQEIFFIEKKRKITLLFPVTSA